MSDMNLDHEIYKRLEKLEKFINHKDNDRQSILQEIHILKNWFISDISVTQHRCLWGYMSFLYNSYGDNYSNLSDFVDDLLLHTGYCGTTTTEVMIQGEKVILKKYKPDSLSYSKCSKRKRTKILEMIIEYSQDKWGIIFNDWYREWQGNPDLIQ